MPYKNAKEFNKHVIDISYPPHINSTEIKSYIQSNINDNSFFLACRSILEISLNRKEARPKESTLDLYKTEFIEIAAKRISQFMEKSKIQNLSDIYEMIQFLYMETTKDGEVENNMVFVRYAEPENFPKMGFVGTFICYLFISCWDELFEKIQEFINKK